MGFGVDLCWICTHWQGLGVGIGSAHMGVHVGFKRDLESGTAFLLSFVDTQCLAGIKQDSPTYSPTVQARLLEAVAFSRQDLGGLTPTQDMLILILFYPGTDKQAASILHMRDGVVLSAHHTQCQFQGSGTEISSVRTNRLVRLGVCPVHGHKPLGKSRASKRPFEGIETIQTRQCQGKIGRPNMGACWHDVA